MNTSNLQKGQSYQVPGKKEKKKNKNTFLKVISTITTFISVALTAVTLALDQRDDLSELWSRVNALGVNPLSNMVAFFERECPHGWEVFTDGAGRFPIGEGQLEGFTYTFNQRGGSTKHSLKVENLPPHSHTVFAEGRHGGDQRFAQDFYSSWGDVLHDWRSKETTQTGQGVPIEIMPPYIVLTMCRLLS